MRTVPFSAIGQFKMLTVLATIVFLISIWSPTHARGTYQFEPHSQTQVDVASSPFSFHYSAEGADGGSSREESWDAAGNVKGGYSLNVNDGRNRRVDYDAGASGFKAKISTNELGTKSVNPADVIFHSSAPSINQQPSIYGGRSQVSGLRGVDVGGAPAPYSFQYAVAGVGGGSSHQESSDGAGNVQGSYSLNIEDGRKRKVDYSAGAGGFKASVDSNEPGTKSDNPADVTFYSSAPIPSAPVTLSGAAKSSVPFQAIPESGAQPYSFDYTAQGVDGSSSHRESSDGSGSVKGSYSLSIKDGRRRKVDYTADTNGYQASVDTNEPGTKSENPAQISFLSTALQPLPLHKSAIAPGSFSGFPATGNVQQVPFKGSFSGFHAASFQLPSGGEEAPSPYSFSYIAEGADGGSSHQQSFDGSGSVKGSYSLNVLKDGRRRKVDYVADAGGFKASVNTNEQGTRSENPAQVSFYSSALQPEPVVGVAPVVGAPTLHAPFSGGAAPVIGAPTLHAPFSGGAAIPFSGVSSDVKTPYSFSYVAEGADGGSFHQESSDGAGSVKGSYSLKTKDGRSRKVDYTADKEGFKASIDTNEPGTKSANPAHVSFLSSGPQIVPTLPVIPTSLKAPLPPNYSGTPVSSVAVQLTPGGKDAPSPYSFNYAVEGGDGGNSHQESSDGAGNVKGSYSLNVKDGRRRRVIYTAGAGGFQANIDTNEPGTKSDNPAHVSFLASAKLPVINGGVTAPKTVLTPISLSAEGVAPSYSFDYNVEGKEGGSSRWESSDGAGNVKGSYTLNVNDGRNRKVDYTAGAGGFKASVNTNEPGTKSSNPAEVSYRTSLSGDLQKPVSLLLPLTPPKRAGISYSRSGVKSWV